MGNICAKERAQGRPTLGNIVNEQALWGDRSLHVGVVPLVCRYHVLPILNLPSNIRSTTAFRSIACQAER